MKIELKNIKKSFYNNQVLSGVDLTILDGEVHALCGENGAGKSTLMKILTGMYKKDEGIILIDGKEVEYKHPKVAEENGIVFIHQELNVIPDMTVEENIFLGKEINKNFLIKGILDKQKMRVETKKLIDELGVNMKPTDRLNHLSVGKQQMVEIAKALHNDVKVLIMDEPTSALTLTETETLFKIISNLKKSGVTTIYISHRMEEIFRICDRLTVLRDGKSIATKNIKETNIDDVVRMMIGREIGDRYPKRVKSQVDIIFEVKNLKKKNIVKDVSFNLKKGEILGVAGLMGSGRSEIMHLIFGSMKVDSGEIFLDGKRVQINSPMDAKKLGIAFITEDRKTEGLLLPFSIRTNISIANLNKIIKMIDLKHRHSDIDETNNDTNNKKIKLLNIIDKKKEREISDKAIDEFLIKSSGIEQSVDSLSGGNQQKVVFAKWVATEPKILILDEPTRGVDVGAKKEIYDIMNELTSNGVSIIMISSELPEIIGMSDRVLVIHEGTSVGIVENEDINEEKIMNLAMRGV